MNVNNLFPIRMVRRRDSEQTVSLTKRRAWYADGDGQQGDGAAGSGQSTGANGKTPLESLPPDVQDYIKELRVEAKSAREERLALKQQLDAAKTAQQAQLAEQGNFKALAEQHAAEVARLKAFETRAADLDAMIRAGNDERMKTIPDNKKPLVQPLIDALSPEKLQAYLNANPSLFVKDPAPDYDAGAGAGSGGTPAPKLTDTERDMARLMNVTEKQYSDMKQQRGQPIELVKKPTTP